MVIMVTDLDEDPCETSLGRRSLVPDHDRQLMLRNGFSVQRLSNRNITCKRNEELNNAFPSHE